MPHHSADPDAVGSCNYCGCDTYADEQSFCCQDCRTILDESARLDMAIRIMRAKRPRRLLKQLLG